MAGSHAPAVGSLVEVDSGAGFQEIIGAQNIEATDGEAYLVDIAGVGDTADCMVSTGVTGAGTLGFEFNSAPLDATHQFLQDRILNAGINADGSALDFRVTIPGGPGSATNKIKTASGTLNEHAEAISRKEVWKVTAAAQMQGKWAVVHATPV